MVFGIKNPFRKKNKQVFRNEQQPFPEMKEQNTFKSPQENSEEADAQASIPKFGLSAEEKQMEMEINQQEKEIEQKSKNYS